MNFSQAVYAIGEDKRLVQLVLILSNPSTTDITIRVFSDDGSATGETLIICIMITVYWVSWYFMPHANQHLHSKISNFTSE